jgi:hypothetical protein
MPTLAPVFAGTTIEFTGTFYKAGAAASLSGATMRATLKVSPDDLDAAAVVQITTSLTASGQITIETGETAVANSGFRIKFLPAATTALITALPAAALYLDLRVKESDADEYVILPRLADDPLLLPFGVPVTWAS